MPRSNAAIVDAEPDYLSNPPPVYPQEARDHNQEGVVVLDIIVSTEGTSETIEIASAAAIISSTRWPGKRCSIIASGPRRSRA